MSWLAAFALTQAVELPIYAFRLRPAPVARRLAMGFAASAATHPWVWFVLPPYLQPTLGFGGYVAVAEAFAIAAEGALLFGFGVPGQRAFTAAALANVASVSVGFVVTRLFA